MAANDKLTLVGKYTPLMIQNGDNTFHAHDPDQICMVTFNIVRTMNSDSVRLFSADELKELFDVPDATNTNFTVFAGNGDAIAVTAHPEGVSFKDKSWYLTFAKVVTGPVRIAGVIIYTPYVVSE